MEANSKRLEEVWKMAAAEPAAAAAAAAADTTSQRPVEQLQHRVMLVEQLWQCVKKMQLY